MIYIIPMLYYIGVFRMYKDFLKDDASKVVFLARLSEEERRSALRNEFNQIISLSDEEITNVYVQLIEAMNTLDNDDKFNFFKSYVECLHDDFGLTAMERVNRAYLSALARTPESVRRRDSSDVYSFISNLNDKYREAFVKSSTEAFRSLPNDIKTTLVNSLSQDVVNLLSR